jgi:tRNA pseudouridine32 synthase/23S rRNA pseudouridine746 synthase
MLADRILFLEGEAIIVDKPAGLPVDRPRDGSLSVENHLDSLRFGFRRWPVPVHRLDRDTSGCLLLARNPKALARFNLAFAEGKVEKTYIAVIAGVPDSEEGLIDLPLAKTSSRESGWRMVGDPRGKPARTHWRQLAVANGRALILFTPETGRTHQLRVHAASGLGLPIFGDSVYGAASIHGMMLHARSLTLPREGKPPVTAEAPLPERFAALGFAASLVDAATPADTDDVAA